MRKHIDFQDRAWNEYLYWQTQDKNALKRINRLIRDIERNGYDGIGKPEPLRGDLSGWWSRRIDDTNRLVYRIDADKIEISQCRGHYDKYIRV
jgi:toxin YoeB